jgi:alkanesulfonate monooxygenase SsuD/methylene tetrahydromethanopterin reductase-like flavin-dependent oxidoreductase (luciferase family)
VTELPGDREPSVLARDLSALDVLSAGRSALLVSGGGSRDPAALARRLEAATVCRALFTEPAPSFEGEYYRISAAANKPPPLQPGGPPIVVDLDDQGDLDDAGVEAMGAPQPGAGPGPVDAVVSGSGPEALGRLVEARGADGDPAVIWRGGATDAEGPSERRLAALLAAGADGVIWQLGADELPEPAALAALAGVLGAALGAPR